jgi:hypothetical protein
MPSYTVIVREVRTVPVCVEAADAQAAVSVVRHGGGDYMEEALEYSITLDPSTWDVEEE